MVIPVDKENKMADTRIRGAEGSVPGVKSYKTKGDLFGKILDEMSDLHEKKSADYGSDQDPMGNLRECASLGLEPWQGVAVRLQDKMARIASMMRKGVLQNESLEDTFIDIAVYGVLGLALVREKKDNG